MNIVNTPENEEATVYAELTVEHNHGILILENARVVYHGKYRYVTGTCMGGGQTSRLFSAHSYTAFETGGSMDWCIGSSRIHKLEDGSYRVSAVFF